MTALERIKEAKDLLTEAEKLDCVCSSFVKQYEGCVCERGQKVRLAKDRLQMALNGI